MRVDGQGRLSRRVHVDGVAGIPGRRRDAGAANNAHTPNPDGLITND